MRPKLEIRIVISLAMNDSKRPEKPLTDALEKLWQGVVDVLDSLVNPAPQPVPIPIRSGQRRR